MFRHVAGMAMTAHGSLVTANRVRTSWFGLAAALLASTALADVPNDPTQVQPLAVGTRAPLFSAQSTDGKVRTFSPDHYRKPTIVIFYRGGWCPY